jgi:hypothetical protein
LNVSNCGHSATTKGGVAAGFKIGLEFGKNFQINLSPRILADDGGRLVVLV